MRLRGKKWKPKGSGTLWDADWKRFTDSQFFLCCSFIWKGIRLISPNCAVMLWGAALWSFPTVEWQLTEDEQPLNLVFRWIKCFFCFSCPALLHSHFEPAASFCWWCCVSFKVERRQAIKFWMLMWWSLTSGPHTHTHTHRHIHTDTYTQTKTKHTYLQESFNVWGA